VKTQYLHAFTIFKTYFFPTIALVKLRKKRRSVLEVEASIKKWIYRRKEDE